jgi:hypothetical protein
MQDIGSWSSNTKVNFELLSPADKQKLDQEAEALNVKVNSVHEDKAVTRMLQIK